jgi:hypothetical protein
MEKKPPEIVAMNAHFSPSKQPFTFHRCRTLNLERRTFFLNLELRTVLFSFHPSQFSKVLMNSKQILPGHCVLVTGGAGYIGSHTVRQLAGRECKIHYGERRAGDPAVLVASSEKAKNILQWQSEFNKLNKIIETAWKRESSGKRKEY